MSWINALVNPAVLVRGVAPRGGPATPQDALAMLVDGRFSWYLSSSRESGFPPLEPVTTATDGGEVADQLLNGLIQLLFGLESAVESLRRIAFDKSFTSDARATAAILASVALGDALRPAEARSLLEHVIFDVPTDHGASALLHLHLGLRLSESGMPEEAISATDEASSLAAISVEENPELASAFLAVAASNRWRFQADDGLILLERNIPPSDIREQIISRTREAMTSYLNRRFDDVMKDPYSSSVLWQADDPVSSAFTAAVTRSECLGDIETLNYARKLAARSNLLIGLGQDRSDAFEALHMLRRAHDAKAARAAIRMYWREGPLEPLRRTAQSLLQPAPTPGLVNTDLELIGAVADLLFEPEADSLVGLILANEGMFPGPNANGIRALSGLLPVISGKRTDEVLQRVVELARTSNDGLVQQRLASLLENLPFSRLSPESMARLGDLADDYLAHRLPRDAQSVSGAFVAAYARATGRYAAELRERFSNEPTIDTAGVLIDGGAYDPDSSAAQVMEELVINALSDQLEKAELGHYEARVTDVGAVAASVLLKTPTNKKGWELLTRFVFSPRVAARHKIGALAVLAQNAEGTPDTLRDRLREDYGQISGTDILFGGETELASVVARLMIATGLLNQRETVRVLLDLAGSREPLARIHATRLLMVVPDANQAPDLMGLALLLTHDQHPDVRSEAAHLLGVLTRSVDPTWMALIFERLIELAREPGARVPLGAVTGLQAGEYQEWPPALADLLHEIVATHPSNVVRREAERALLQHH